jgi:hypothetical protein
MEQVHKILSVSNEQANSPEIMKADEVFNEVFNSMKSIAPSVDLPQWKNLQNTPADFVTENFQSSADQLDLEKQNS